MRINGKYVDKLYKYMYPKITVQYTKLKKNNIDDRVVYTWWIDYII